MFLTEAQVIYSYLRECGHSRRQHVALLSWGFAEEAFKKENPHCTLEQSASWADEHWPEFLEKGLDLAALLAAEHEAKLLRN